MNFKNLFIHNSSGRLSGKVGFENDLGEIQLNLDAQMVEEILQVVGRALVRVTKTAADEMTAKVIDDLGLDLVALSDGKP